jgi:hypothetical protein
MADPNVRHECKDALRIERGFAYAWLVERGQSESHRPTVWWIAGPTLRSRDGEKWTETAAEATRFATWAEAQAVVDDLFIGSRIGDPPTARATQHGFAGKAGGGMSAPLFISARWDAGIGRVVVRYDPRGGGGRCVYLRLQIEEAKELLDDLSAVIEERRSKPDREEPVT